MRRGGAKDLADADIAIDRLSTMPTDPGSVMQEIWLLRLRALLAQARGEVTAYCSFRDRYRKMAADKGFEGHLTMAAAMP